MSLDASGPPQGWPGATQLPASGTADALTFTKAIDEQLSAVLRRATGSSSADSESLPTDTALAPFVTLPVDTPLPPAGGSPISVAEATVNDKEADDTQSAGAVKLVAETRRADAAQSAVRTRADSQPSDSRQTAAAKPAADGQPAADAWLAAEAQFATYVPLVVYAQLAAAARQQDAVVPPGSESPADGSNDEPIDDAGWRPALPSPANADRVLDGSLKIPAQVLARWLDPFHSTKVHTEGKGQASEPVDDGSATETSSAAVPASVDPTGLISGAATTQEPVATCSPSNVTGAFDRHEVATSDEATERLVTASAATPSELIRPAAPTPSPTADSKPVDKRLAMAEATGMLKASSHQSVNEVPVAQPLPPFAGAPGIADISRGADLSPGRRSDNSSPHSGGWPDPIADANTLASPSRSAFPSLSPGERVVRDLEPRQVPFAAERISTALNQTLPNASDVRQLLAMLPATLASERAVSVVRSAAHAATGVSFEVASLGKDGQRDHSDLESHDQSLSARSGEPHHMPPPSRGPQTTEAPSASFGSGQADGFGGRGVAAPAADRVIVSLPNESGVASSIVQSMRMQWRNGVGSAIVQLEPEYLGAVTISLQVQNNSVMATLHAVNGDVRAWIEANESSLRQALADQGLTLDRLIVSDEAFKREQMESETRRRQKPKDETPAKRAARASETSTFEIVV